jgi:DNA-binding NarL/FixJ family response regulator
LNTAYPQYRQNFMTWGADAYVVKSSDLAELKEKIREVIQQKRKASTP